MNDGHEKSNRNDKAKKPHYWEEWRGDVGKLPVSNGAVGLMRHLDAIRDTRRPLKVVGNWSPIQLLDHKLIQVCRSQAISYEKTFEITINARGMTVTRTLGREIDEIAYWVTRAINGLGHWMKQRRALRIANYAAPRGNPSLEIAEELADAMRSLEKHFSVQRVLAAGELPADFMGSETAKESINAASLRMVDLYLCLRSGIDLYLQRPRGRKYLPKT